MNNKIKIPLALLLSLICICSLILPCSAQEDRQRADEIAQDILDYNLSLSQSAGVQEFVDGEWKTYDLSSIGHADAYGYEYYYDGYMVNYDGDGTYSYSFVVPMDNGAPRKFRIVVDEDFKGWPEINKESDIIEDPINYFLQPSELLLKTTSVTSISSALLSKNKDSISLSGFSYAVETYMHFFQNSETDRITTGQYVVFKYRLPTGISQFSNFEIFAI